jgi:hypothetical protein
MTTNEEEFYQRIKGSIKESQLDMDPTSFSPHVRIVLEIPMEPVDGTPLFIEKQKMYELIGKAICERWEGNSSTSTN